MNSNLKIISYNCQSLRSNVGIVQNLLTNCDILCLQETLIDENNCGILDQIDENFMSAYVPSVRKPDCFVGRSSAGLVIFWRKGLSIKCSPINYNKRIMGLKMVLPNNLTFLLLNVYMTCGYQSPGSYLEYNTTLAQITNILESDEFFNVCIAGDFNADPEKGRFFHCLSQFLNENSLVLSDVNSLPANSYTYISPTSACNCSWLDHVCVSSPSIISDHKILYGTAVYDHIPFSFNLKLPHFCNPDFNVNHKSNEQKIKWDAVKDHDKQTYADALDNICIGISYDVLLCRNNTCNDTSHKIVLDKLFCDLTDAIKSASSCLPGMKIRHKNTVIGWNTHCKDFYNLAREKYLIWHNGGRNRSGDDFEAMKTARSRFKNALKYCKENEKQIKHEVLLGKFENANKTQFWKEISKINGSGTSNTIQIDSETSAEKTVKIFDDKYKRVLDDSSCQTHYDDGFIPSYASPIPVITLDEICRAIHSLKIGLGWDGIHANHIKFAGPVFINLLCKFMNKLLTHSYVPTNMIYGEIRPVIKSKILGKGDSENYRPVLNSSMFLKVLEYCLQPILLDSLKLSNHQFGYRKDTGCLSSIAVVKETIFKYNAENSNVHCVLVDLSKAFDKINHNILFAKLSRSNLNSQVIELLRAMYDNAYVNTKFNGLKGEPWKIGNGVRQGGILSPLLFSYYIDETLNSVSDLNVGCSILGHKTSVIAYADDVILLAPTASAVQYMFDELCGMFSKLGMSINLGKSKYIIFTKRGSKICSNAPNIYMNGLKLGREDKVIYLGVILAGNGSTLDDVNRVTSSFLKQFNGMYWRYNFLRRDMLYFLFKSYTSSFYGIDLWFEKMPDSHLDRVCIAYHKAIKRISGLNVWDSNHEACEMVGVQTFSHLRATRLVCFWHKLFHTKSVCLGNLNYYFGYKSQIYGKLKAMFMDNYSVDILNNPLCAIKARISFVQRNEPRSHYAQTM